MRGLYRFPAALVAMTAVTATSLPNYADYVNPFIGGEGPDAGSSYGGGDIFVGAALPFGVAKVGIDTYDLNQSFAANNGGWTPRGLVTGISMMHESGTGGPPKYGLIAQMPLTAVDGAVNLLDNTTYWQQRGAERAGVGWYQTTLANGVQLQLSASRHAGLVEYDFPAGGQHVLVDVSHFLSNEIGTSLDQYYADGAIAVTPDGAQYTGQGTFGGGFSNSAPMTTFFCGEFDTPPARVQTLRGRNTFPGLRQHVASNEPIPQPTMSDARAQQAGPLGDRVGALFSWNGTARATVRARVGISMISAAKACAFKDRELAWDVGAAVANATREWNADVFSKIQVPTDAAQNRTNLVLLYSSLYFAHLMPSDRRGENPLWASADSWDDFYTLWDIFRCTVSLYHLIQPAYYASMVRALIEIWQHEGYMPDGRSGNSNGLTQGGSNADNVLADAYVKGLPGVNWTAGYAAMVKDAEVQPFNTFLAYDPTGSIQQGRGALDDWLALGYVALDHHGRSISQTIEYSLNDFALAQVARGEAPADVPKYLARAGNWRNLWNDNVTHKGFSGFPAPRLANGDFALDDYNPAQCGGCSWGSVTYEGTPFEYAFTVPHDMQTLIELMGGAERFEQRLDYIFQPGTSEANLGPNGQGINTLMNIGNEPDFATPYEYHYINKQAKSVQRSRAIANQYFHNARSGIPGNSDAGALNSWLVWQMLGLYPVATQPVYLLGAPWFADANVSVNADRVLRVRAHGLDNARAFYVQGVRVNGHKWDRNWIEHADVMVEGGEIEFDMGSEPVAWETGSVPPSPGHVAL